MCKTYVWLIVSPYRCNVCMYYICFHYEHWKSTNNTHVIHIQWLLGECGTVSRIWFSDLKLPLEKIRIPPPFFPLRSYRNRSYPFSDNWLFAILSFNQVSVKTATSQFFDIMAAWHSSILLHIERQFERKRRAEFYSKHCDHYFWYEY